MQHLTHNLENNEKPFGVYLIRARHFIPNNDRHRTHSAVFVVNSVTVVACCGCRMSD